MQQFPADFLAALAEHDEVLVTSREGASRGTVPMWFIVHPPGVVYLFTFGFSEKARRWRSDPWVRLAVPDAPGRLAAPEAPGGLAVPERRSLAAEGVVSFVPAEEVDDALGAAIVERWGVQGAPTIEGLRRTLRDGVHVLVRVEAAWRERRSSRLERCRC